MNVLTTPTTSAPWPTTAQHTPADIHIGGVPLSRLAARYSTPLYVLDEQDVRNRCRAYRAALPGATVLYAAKAFLNGAMAEWVRDEGLGLDVCSGNELHLAAGAGFPPARMVLHGNAKSPLELQDAVRLGVGRIVIDAASETTRIAALADPARPQGVYVRVVPGIAAGHHAAVRTGVEGQKFGFAISTGEAEEAVRRVLAAGPRLFLAGLHCHLGSQIGTVQPYLDAVDRLVPLLARIKDRYAVELPELDLGGGHGVAYRTDDQALDLDGFARHVPQQLTRACASYGIAVPRLVIEPGRAIVGPAGVAVYRVLAVKRTGQPGQSGQPGRLTVAVDGGMSDNPRPALYDARYTAALVGRRTAGPTVQATVVGRHCEAGDVLVHDAELPADVRPGDLVAVAVAGAYHLSMASGYNHVGRPALVAVRDGAARIVTRRETLDDFLRRDAGR